MAVILQKYFWAFSFLLMTCVAALAADGIGSYLVWRIDTAPSASAPLSAGIVSERPIRAEDEFQGVVRGNLFDARQRGKGSGGIPAASGPETGTRTFSGQLVGTIVGYRSPSYAIIESAETHEQNLYGIGDKLDPQTKVAAISPEKVILRRGSEEIELKTVVPGNAESGGGAGIRNIGEKHWTLDKQVAQAALGDMNRLLTQAQIIPAFSGGRPDGFRIAAIAPGSFFDQIGLQNNDILQRINGVEIKDPDNFIRVFAQLKEETSISLDLKRTGRRETFQYDIR